MCCHISRTRYFTADRVSGYGSCIPQSCEGLGEEASPPQELRLAGYILVLFVLKNYIILLFEIPYLLCMLIVCSTH